MEYLWTPNDGDVAALAARLRKAGQLNVTLYSDSVGMTPFETPGQLALWREAMEAHFKCTLKDTDDGL